jgi:hypothetical protein
LREDEILGYKNMGFLLGMEKNCYYLNYSIEQMARGRGFGGRGRKGFGKRGGFGRRRFGAQRFGRSHAHTRSEFSIYEQ